MVWENTAYHWGKRGTSPFESFIWEVSESTCMVRRRQTLWELLKVRLCGTFAFYRGHSLAITRLRTRLHVRQVPSGSTPPLSVYNLEIILKMVKIPTHKLYIFLIVMIRCIVLHVKQVPWGSSPLLSVYNLDINLKMVKIPTHKLYNKCILNGDDKMQTSSPGLIPTPLSIHFRYYLDNGWVSHP